VPKKPGSRWKHLNPEAEKAEEKHRKELAGMKKYLRLPLADFLSELKVTETSPQYADLVQIWSEFHE
jgi:hypothetical protein